MWQQSWRTSSYSSDQGGNCVEFCALGHSRAIRDSKDPAGPVLRIPAAGWFAFTAAVRAGEFD